MWAEGFFFFFFFLSFFFFFFLVRIIYSFLGFFFSEFLRMGNFLFLISALPSSVIC